MLDRDLLRHDPERVRRGIARKGGDVGLVDRFSAQDAAFRAAATRAGELQAEANRAAKSIGQLMAQGKREEAEEAKRTAAAAKAGVGEAERAEREAETTLREIELLFPNLPADSVPDGRTEEENVVRREWGTKPSFDFAPKPHWEIAESLGLLDPARGAKIAGSGFALYTGLGARLQRALFNWMVDFQTGQNSYKEIFPPYLVNAASLVGTGNLPKFEEDLYRTQDDLYLIPTAEVP
ncbi:serine--tRNA ligase, partial [bacterium]